MGRGEGGYEFSVRLADTLERAKVDIIKADAFSEAKMPATAPFRME